MVLIGCPVVLKPHKFYTPLGSFWLKQCDGTCDTLPVFIQDQSTQCCFVQKRWAETRIRNKEMACLSPSPSTRILGPGMLSRPADAECLSVQVSPQSRILPRLEELLEANAALLKACPHPQDWLGLRETHRRRVLYAPCDRLDGLLPNVSTLQRIGLGPGVFFVPDPWGEGRFGVA